MSVLVVACSKCGQQFGIPAGKQAACPKCMTINQPRVGGPTPGVMLSPTRTGPVQGVALGPPQPWMGGVPGASFGYTSPPGQGPPLAAHQTSPPGFAVSPHGQGGYGPSYGAGGYVSPQGAGPMNAVNPYGGIMPAAVQGMVLPAGPVAYSGGPPPVASYSSGPPPFAAYSGGPPPVTAYAGGPPPVNAYSGGPPPVNAYSGGSAMPVAAIVPATVVSLPLASVAVASPAGSRVLQLAFSGFNLPKSSSLTVTVEDRNGVLPEFKQEPFRTEVVFDSKNPIWVRKLEIPKRDDIKLAFVVFEKDKRYALLGGTPLNEITDTQAWRKPLQDPKTGHRLPSAAISAKWEEISTGGDTVEFEAAATGLRSYDSNGLSDPFMQVFRVEGANLSLVHQTEVIPKCLSPTWKPVSLRLSQLTGNPSLSSPSSQTTSIVFKLFDWNPSGKTNFMGEVRTTIPALLSNQTAGSSARYALVKEKDKKKENRGALIFNKFRVVAPSTPVAVPSFSSPPPSASPQQPRIVAVAVAGSPQGAVYNQGAGAHQQSQNAEVYQQPPPAFEMPPPAYNNPEEEVERFEIPVASPALNDQFSSEPLMSTPAAQQEEVWEEIPPELLMEVSPEELVYQQQQQAMMYAQQQQLQQQQAMIYAQQQQLLQEEQQQLAPPLPSSSPLVLEASIPLPEDPIVMPAPLPLPFELPPPVFEKPPEPYFVVPPEDLPPPVPAIPEEARRPPPAARGAPPPARGAPPPARGGPPPARGGLTAQGNYPFDPNFKGGLASSRPAVAFSVDHAVIHQLIYIMSTPAAMQYLATVCDAPFRSTLHRPSVERLSNMLGQRHNLEWDAIPYDLKDQVPNLLKTWVNASNFRFGQDRSSDLNMALVCRAIISTGKYYKTFDSMSIAFTALNDLGGVYQSNYTVSG